MVIFRNAKDNSRYKEHKDYCKKNFKPHPRFVGKCIAKMCCLEKSYTYYQNKKYGN